MSKNNRVKDQRHNFCFLATETNIVNPENFIKNSATDPQIALKLPINHLASAEVKESANPRGLAAILPLLFSRLEE